MSVKMLAPETVDAFARDGYIVIPDLVTMQELEHFQLIVRNAVRDRKQYDTRPLTEKTLYEQSFMQCMNLWEDFPAVRPLTFHPKIAQVAAELLGVDAVRLWHDQALFKEPHGRETDPHQDLPYWPMAETVALTAWIPFEGTTLSTGCMGYVPGSHQLGIRKLVNIFSAGEQERADQAKEILTGDLVYVEVPKGSIAFHHGLTAHDAKPNRSDRMREVHTMIFFKDGNTRNAVGEHYIVDRPGIRPGEPIASDVTPIAWPRPSGSLPATPTPMTGLSERMKRSGALPTNG